MKFTPLTPCALAGLMLLAAMSQSDATAPHTKPTLKKLAHRTSAGRPIVLGTTQMPGDFGKFGQTYTIGKSEPINFTLRRNVRQ